MNLTDLEKQRKTLLLRKSMGNATEEDLKQLARVLDLINKAEPSIASEMENTEDLDFTKNWSIVDPVKKKTDQKRITLPLQVLP